MTARKNRTGSRTHAKRSSRVKRTGSASRRKTTRLIARAATASEIRKSVGLTRAEMRVVDRLLARAASRPVAKRASG